MKLSNLQRGFITPQIVIVILLVVALIFLTVNYFNKGGLDLGQLSGSSFKSTTPSSDNEQQTSTITSGQSTESENAQVQNQKTTGSPTNNNISPTPSTTPVSTRTNPPGTSEERAARESAPEEGTPVGNPIFGNFRIIDFHAAYNLVPITIITPVSSFTNNLIGKIRILNINSGPTPTPTPTPIPASTSQKTAMVVTLSSVKIHDDKDTALNGEVQIIASARSGFTEQLTAWPYRNWDEANNGDTLNINMPIFVLPKEQVADKISVWISALDNDSLPEGVEDLIKKAYDISTGSQSFYDNPANFVNDQIYAQTIGRFLNWLGGDEHIGTLTTQFNKPNYGMWARTFGLYEKRSGDATFNLKIEEVSIPQKPLHVDITIKKIYSSETGDYDLAGWKGDVYVWARVSDGFAGGREMNFIPTRIPEDGEHEMRDGSTWDINKEILSSNVSSPILYYEVGVWDNDPSGNNDDQLEIISKTLKMADYKAGDVLTIKEDGDDGVDANAEIEMEVKFSAVN